MNLQDLINRISSLHQMQRTMDVISVDSYLAIRPVRVFILKPTL